MPVLSNARGIVISNSQFTDVNISNGPTGIDILLEASLPDAAHDSSARDQAPRCFPGTREQYVRDIIQWAVPATSDTPLPIFRMKGPAGVGKSAVAQTSAEKVKARGKLGAAFFFSINGRNKPAQFFTTIAYQLSTNYPDYQDLLERKIRRDRTLVNKAPASQFHELIAQPLQELESSGRGIGKRVPIFVDGLDECEDERIQCAIIDIVALSVREDNLPLCWAFFSRPEPHIEATFSRPNISALSHTVILPISRNSDGDIEIYLRAGFENILRRHNIHLDVPWPPESDIKLLVKASGGLFIYAASVLRFIDQTGSLGPEEPLLAVLAAISHKGADAAPFAHLDAFYMLVLGRIPKEMLPAVRLVLITLCHLNYPQNTLILANLLKLSKMGQRAVCNRLSAVLRVRDPDQAFDIDPDIDTSRPYPENPGLSHEDIKKLRRSISGQLGGQIFFYHKSFRDFLVDPRRSGLFGFESLSIHELLFEHCFGLELEYERAYSLHGSAVIPAPVPLLSYPHTTELVNSIIKAEVYIWAGHLCSQLIDTPELDFKFLQKYGRTDFRKPLSVCLSLCAGAGGPCRYWNCDGYQKLMCGTALFRTFPGKFQYFDVDKFKKVIERRQQAEVLRPYLPPTQQPNISGHIDSGLYLIGHEPKSIFWHWEINYAEQYFQEFVSLDLAEGERVFREEWFDLEF